MKTYHLDANQVPAHLRGSYSGKKFRVEICEALCIPADAGLWDSGSRDTYHALQLSTGKEIDIGGSMRAPWDSTRKDYQFKLEPDMAIVQKTIFQGKDLGLTFYIHPSNAAALLPAPKQDLDETEKFVLEATRGYKSSYMGKDRYTLATEYNYSNKWQPTRAQWNEAKERLISKGYLNKAGAITTAGKNAIA